MEREEEEGGRKKREGCPFSITCMHVLMQNVSRKLLGEVK